MIYFFKAMADFVLPPGIVYHTAIGTGCLSG